MSNLLLWLDGREVSFKVLNIASNELVLNGGLYSRENRYLGDYDYIVDDRETVIGVAFIIDVEDPIYQSSFVTSSENTFVESGLMLIFFKKSDRFYIKTLQAMFTSIYQSKRGEYALVLPDFDATEDLEKC